MLQPSQVEDVSGRYAAEIADIRAFLAKAGFACGTAATLHQLAERLQQDRSFHRDLTLHVWVMIHGHGETISYSDLLGILAVAAAGTSFASVAGEQDAHALLRFLMEARDAMTALQQHSPPVPANEVSPMPETPFRLPPAATGKVQERNHRSIGWRAAAIACLLALLAGWWVRRGSVAPAPRPAPIASGSAVPAPSFAPDPTAPPTTETIPATEKPMEPSQQNRTLPMLRFDHARDTPRRTEPPPPSAHEPNAAASPSKDMAPAMPTPGAAPLPAAPSAATADHAAPIVRSPSPSSRSASPPVPAVVLAQRLDNPGMSRKQEEEYDSNGRLYPHLLRRTHAPGQIDDVDELVAANGPAPLPGGNNRALAAGTTPSGIVRPTSPGVMASYVLSSPAAAYPAAAASARVQGTVKLQAVIDPAGNVAAARIISGPALLRDAALNAVQQWRYRPYIAGGKARSFTTEAVMEFELH